MVTNSCTASQANTSASVQIMRVSDASGYENVVLRPKTVQQHNSRLARPFAIISGLFKSHRECGAFQAEKGGNLRKNSPHCYENNKIVNRKSKRMSWNIFKSKKNRDELPPTFQRFQEPLNVERVSLPIGAIASDAEWYDLNKEEMSLFEARVSDIVHEFNNYNQKVGDFESESMYRCDLGRYVTISSKILWSHNLSDNASNVNLLGANINKEQIHSNVLIEDNAKSLAQTVNTSDALNLSFVSTDSDGYAVMQPILPSEKYVQPAVLIDNIIESDTTDSHCHNDSDDSKNLSSEFGSEDGRSSSPRKSISSVASSPKTIDLSEAFPLQATPSTIKNMQNKPSKKCLLQIKSKKLLKMLYVKHHAPS